MKGTHPTDWEILGLYQLCIQCLNAQWYTKPIFEKSSQLQVPKARNVTTRLLSFSKKLHSQRYTEDAIELTFSRITISQSAHD